MDAALYDLSPLLTLLLLGALLAAGPVLWVVWRKRGDTPSARLQTLTWITLFLTFDLVLFGAFTRLTDSGLGCPDWPGCYGSASPLGAKEEITLAQNALPSGPVTHGKAWVEMVHRYFATGVGALIFLLAVGGWVAAKGAARRNVPSPWLASFTLLWVCVQGAFGALTVTMKLFPAIVSMHLLGAYALLALLTVQALRWAQAQGKHVPVPLPLTLWWWIVLALAMLVVQAVSGAWVSTNYAVLACTEFPKCQGSWWPSMDFSTAFELWRPLGYTQDGAYLSVQSLTAIHFVHRMLAGVTVVWLGVLAWRVWPIQPVRSVARALAALLALQVITGLSNVVLGWPLFAAVLHTGGAGAMVVTLVWLLTCSVARTGPTHLQMRSPQ
jgi:heme a synthase